MKNIKLIISEVDGIITDGRIPKDELDNTVFKSFCFRDFEAINEIKRVGYTFGFLSADNSISYNLCRKKNIPFYWAQKSKLDVLYKILRRYEASAEQLLYIGSAFSDKECMKLAEFSVCTIDAPVTIRNIADHCADIISGEGVISYVYESILSK